MALKDKITTYNYSVTYEDHSDDTFIMTCYKTYKNISRVAVDYYENWYNMTYENVNSYTEKNKVN